MSDYDYLNARVRAMGARLLPSGFFEQALAVDSPAALAEALTNSDYAQDLAESAGAPRGATAVEAALRRNLFRTLRKVRAMAPDKPQRLLTIQVNRWDVDNIRAIVRGKAVGAEAQDIMAGVLPAGEFTEAQLRELAAQPDVIAVADTLMTWGYDFASELREAVREHAEPLDRPAIEVALDRAYFDWALAELDPEDEAQLTLLDLIRQQIDLANLLMVLRTVRERERGRESSGPQPIRGGSLAARVMTQMDECAKLEDVFEIAGGTYFAPAIEKGILAFGETGRLALMERFLEMVVVGAGCKLFRSAPLGAGVAIGYIWRKYNEFVNLRIVLRGKTYSVPVNTIREELLLA